MNHLFHLAVNDAAHASRASRSQAASGDKATPTLRETPYMSLERIEALLDKHKPPAGFDAIGFARDVENQVRKLVKESQCK